MTVIGARAYRCFCRQPIPQQPECGDKGTDDDE